jgi:hypothetical protein
MTQLVDGVLGWGLWKGFRGKRRQWSSTQWVFRGPIYRPSTLGASGKDGR